MVSLLWGHTDDQVSEALLTGLVARAQGQDGRTYLLVPEQYSHEAERQLCVWGGASISLYAEVLTFSRLADRVLSETGQALVLDAGGRLLTLWRAVSHVQNHLRHFRPVCRKPDFLQSLMRTIDQIKCDRITIQDFRDLSDAVSGPSADRYHDIALLLESYEAETLTGALDPRDPLTLTAGRLPQATLLPGSVWWLEGFSDFSRQELDVIKQIARVADITVGLSPCRPAGDELFATLHRTKESLASLAASVPCPFHETTLAEDIAPVPPGIRFIRAHAFEDDAPASTAADSGIELWRARSPAEECRAAAARIRRLVALEGYRYRDIALSAHDMSQYRDVWEQTAIQYDIPVFFDEMDAVGEKPLFLHVRWVLDVLLYRAPFDALMSLLKDGLLDVPQDRADELARYMLVWALHGRRFLSEKDLNHHPRGVVSEWTPEDRAQLTRLNETRQTVAEPLRALMAEMTGVRTARHRAVALNQYFEITHLPERLENACAEMRSLHLLKEAEETEQLWDIVVSALTQCAAILADNPTELSEFRDLFLLTLSAYQVGSIPVSIDRVVCGSCDRSRAHKTRCGIVLGMTEEAFPGAGEAQGLLDDDSREEMSALGLTYGQTWQERQDRELRVLYKTLTRVTEKLILFHPLRSTADEESPPAFVIDWLSERLTTPVSEVDEIDLYTAAPTPCADWLQCHPSHPAAERAREAGQGLPAFSRLTAAPGRPPEAVVHTGLLPDNRPLSVTRLETYLTCHYAYLLRYGLKLRPLKPAEWEPLHVGLLTHSVLEQVTRAVMREGGFRRVSEQKLHDLTEQAFAQERDRAALSGMRPKALAQLAHLRLAMDDIVGDTARELADSDFAPLDVELSLSGHSEGSLGGIADRVDGWQNGDTLYLRVIDYKTGVKKFRLSDIYHGFGLQMLHYLFTLTSSGQYGTLAPVIRPAGVLYVPVKPKALTMKSRPSDAEYQAGQQEDSVRSGLLLDSEEVIDAMARDRGRASLPLSYNKSGALSATSSVATASQFGLLSRHVTRIMNDTAQLMRSGDVRCTPTGVSGQTPCDSCDFASVCLFDPAREERVRFLPTLRPPEVWQRLSEEGSDES